MMQAHLDRFAARRPRLCLVLAVVLPIALDLLAQVLTRGIR